MRNLSLYIHIPFCVRKCNYCDFLSAPCDENTRQKYMEALCREIKQRATQFKEKKVDTVFFGGGTPSILETEQISKIMSTIRREFQILSNAEITLEMNPGTVDKEKLETYKKLGINRLSIGLQSANNEELKVLGRIHTWEDFLQTWEMVREVGFSNVNIDLMSALPGQTLESYKETLEKVLALEPEHISAYSLIIEEGTLFFEWFRDESELEKDKFEQEMERTDNQISRKMRIDIANKKLPDEIMDRQMYELTKRMLEEQGYYRYEISNYALKGYECKHNIGYWKRKEYLGLGLGAASLLFVEDEEKSEIEANEQFEQTIDYPKRKSIRCSNITELKEYLRNDEEERNRDKEASDLEKKNGWKQTEELTELSLSEQMEEFMFLGLRMMEGVSPAEFEKQFGQSLQEVYGKQIVKLEKQGLIKFNEKTKRYALTLQGIDVSNQVFVEFLF